MDGTDETVTDAFQELNEASLGSGVWIILGVYLGSLILACLFVLARNRGLLERFGKSPDIIEEGNRVNHHYVAGGSLGFFVMPLTIFATFFSGVTLVGLPSESSVLGFWALRWFWAGFGTLIGYMIFGPRLRRLSEFRGGYMSAVDVLSDRFRDVELRLICAFVQIFAAFLYLVAQFVAMGNTLSSISNGAIPFWAGASGLAVIMLIYESIGGMEMVAWTDAMQGLMLLVGFLFIYIVQTTEFGGLPNAVRILAEEAPLLVASPSLEQLGAVVPFLVGFFPFMLYGHMQQRIFAASSEKSLRYALVFMAGVIIIIHNGAILLGILSKAYFIDTLGADVPRGETFGTAMRILLLSNGTGHVNYFFASLILASGVAALMSTADSALLSMSCVVSLDIVKAFFARSANDSSIVWIGRGVSVLGCILGVAVAATDPVINDLIAIQQQFLLQISPCMLAAMYCKNARSRPLTIGLVMGMVVNIIFVYGPFDATVNAFAGFCGLAVNVPLSIGLHYVDHPILNYVRSGDPLQWERFGDALPEKMYGWELPGQAPELIHRWKTLTAIFVFAFLFAIPWFYEFNSINILAGGLPDWVVHMYTVWPIIFAVMGAIIYFWWVDNPAQEEDVKDLEGSVELSEKSKNADDDSSAEKPKKGDDDEGSLTEMYSTGVLPAATSNPVAVDA